jgi:hypothetical protein
LIVMDAVECAKQTRDLVAVGGAFMLTPATTERGDAIGLDFGEFYALGRGGVLGDVDADVVVATFGYFSRDLVQRFWNGAKEKVAPPDAALAYADACRTWGREHLASVPAVDELAGLLERTAAAASPVGAPLFGGWRAVPLPDDAPGRMMQLMHVLRELRGGLHLDAVLAAGLTPHEALTINEPGQVQLFGWAEPAPDVESKRAILTTANETTDRMIAHAFEALTDDERSRLADATASVTAAYAATQS